MTRLLLICISSLLLLTTASADDVSSWRKHMRILVTEGNKHYERSYRRGILIYADSIKAELSNCPTQNDSLEFTAEYLKLMGDYHYENSNYESASYSIAEDYYRQALAIYNDNGFFSGHFDRAAMIQRELAQLYYKQERYTEAQTEMAQADTAYYYAYCGQMFGEGDQNYLDYLEMHTFLAICDARRGEDSSKKMDEVLSFYAKNKSYRDTREGQEKYYEALRKKGKITILAGGSGTDALTYYKDYFSWRRTDALATLATMTAEEREDYWMRMRPFVADAYQTEDADAAFLYDITLFAKGLLLQIERFSGRGKTTDEALASLRHNWRDVQRELKADECAVEFIQYEKGGRQLMAALVLRSNGRPKWVPFLAPNDLLGYDCNGQTCGNRLSTTNGYQKNDLYNDSTLCTKLWNSDLMELIKGCKKMYFAPDGYLHTLAIEYMLPKDQSTTAQQLRLYRLTSTRQIINRKYNNTANKGGKSATTQAALLIGGVRYDGEASTGKDSISTTVADNDTIACSFMRSLGGRFQYLKGTKEEIDSIYATRDCAADTLLTGYNATESAFHRLCSSYPIVTVSTHGYFGAAETSIGTDLKPCYTDESLSQSIIALAGCNASISAENTDDTNEYDGLLSARELSRCDMSQARLVVISACQTGLGYITADGVYGIQRGLKNAGVGSMILSLWNVSDEATSLLMTTFHHFHSQGMTTAEAFRAARQALIDTARVADATKTASKLRFNAARLVNEVVSTEASEEDYSSPQYTNAFILIDAIE